MHPLSETLQVAWDRFANELNLVQPHGFDEDRFAEFVRTAHRRGRAHDVDFRELIRASWPTLDDELAEELAQWMDVRYGFGRVLLRGRTWAS